MAFSCPVSKPLPNFGGHVVLGGSRVLLQKNTGADILSLPLGNAAVGRGLGSV